MIMEGKLSPAEFQTEAFEDEDLLQQGGISLIKILEALLLIELMSHLSHLSHIKANVL